MEGVGLPNWQIDMDNNVLEGALREAQYTYEELVSQGRHDEAAEATQIIRNMQVARNHTTSTTTSHQSVNHY
jgi:hypothetical protein